MAAPDRWSSSPRASATFFPPRPCQPHMVRPNLFFKSAQPRCLHAQRDASVLTGAPCFCLPRCWSTCAGTSCATCVIWIIPRPTGRNSPAFRPTGPPMKKRSTPHGGACHGGHSPARTLLPAADILTSRLAPRISMRNPAYRLTSLPALLARYCTQPPLRNRCSI